MRKRILSVLLVLLMLLLLILYSLPAEASEKYPVRKMRVTCYTYPEGSITASGFGIDKDGDGIGSIQEGTSIDVFRRSLERCKEWVDAYGDYCYVQVIPDAEG